MADNHGEARDWLDKEPPRSILTWDDLVSKFINQYFPPSKTTYYRNEIITFYQKPNEAFNEAWERFKGLLRQCPHHGFSELHQLDTFYNSLNSNDQDALDSAAGGNFLDKMPQEGLAIIESKSKVRYSRSRANDSRTLEEPSTLLVPTPVVSNPQKEPEQNPETSTEKVQNPNLENTTHVQPLEEEDSIFMEILKPKAKKTVNVEIQDLNSPNPNSYQSKLPYPERMRVREHDKPSAQYSRFLKMFKQLRLKIGLKDALIEMPKFNKWLSSLLRNKEKLEEIAITTVNAECSAIIMNKVPEKLEDPGKFLIPYQLSDDDSHNLVSEVITNHEPLPLSTFQSQGNIHQTSVIESLPVSPTPVEDSELTQEEIDIFLVQDDLIPPDVENDDSKDEVNELPNLDHQDDPSIPRPPPEPPDIKKCFEPEVGILIIKESKGVSESHDFMTGILPTLPTCFLTELHSPSFFLFRE
ncbi:reverse transcriptase domain-containing protein [Tanacetum coccineum]